MQSQSAFTLMEMLVTITIITILLAVSLPSMNSLTTRAKEEILLSQIHNAISFAQQEAQVRHIAVAVCGSRDNVTCSQEWNTGLLVFMDEYDDGVIHDREQILSVVQFKLPHGNIYWRSYPFYHHYAVFTPAVLMPSNNGTFWHCHTNSHSPLWAIMLGKSGNARIAYPDVNGEIRDARDKLLECEMSLTSNH